jgi:hypothetical protein
MQADLVLMPAELPQGKGDLLAFPAAQGDAAISSRLKRLKMSPFGNRIFECRADHGQDGR